jgi:hypothetical protein
VPNESQQNLKATCLYETAAENKPGNKYEIKIDAIEQCEGKERNKEKGKREEEANGNKNRCNTCKRLKTTVL